MSSGDYKHRSFQGGEILDEVMQGDACDNVAVGLH
jgi:hypothetical protein